MDNAPKSAITQDSKLHFLDYWRIIRIRKTIILAVFLLILLTTIAVTFYLPVSYASTASIRMEKDTPDIGLLGAFAPQQQQYDPYWLLTEFEVLQSKSMLYPVIEKLSLGELYAKRFKQDTALTIPESYQVLLKELDIKQRRNTTVVEIKAFFPTADMAATIANTVAEQYIAARDASRFQRVVRGQNVLTNQASSLMEQLTAAREKMDSLRTELRIPDLIADAGAVQTLDASKMVALQNMRTEAEASLTANSELLTRLKTKEGPELRSLLAAAVPTPELAALIAKLNDAELQLAASAADYGPNHPQVLKIRSAIEKLNEQIDAQVRGIIAAREAMVGKDLALVHSVSNKLDAAITQSSEQNEKFAPYFLAKRNYEDKQRLWSVLQSKKWQEELDGAISKASSVEFVSKAEPDRRPVKPNKTLNIALGTLVGLMVGIGLAFFIEYLDTSVKTIDDVEQAMQSPVLGVIPQNVGALINEGNDSPHAEAYRVLRTNVLFSRKDPNLRTMTVVSGGAGEGKSTTIFNLATVFAQHGSRVLVVDSDLRRPSLHKILNLSNSLGLTNYLLSQNKLEEVVQTTKQPLLDFLPSGKLPSSSMGILNSNRMKEFVQEAKSRYDFVFFDSPPIMGVSDASVLASEVDMAILVVQYRKYPQQMTIRAKQMVEKVGGRLLGVVLNNINISQDSYYYYYSGYYYDYYSKNDESKPAGEKKSKSASSGKPAAAEKSGVDLKQKY